MMDEHSVPEQGVLYYFICSHLWDVMAAYHYLEVHYINVDEVSVRWNRWGATYSSLINWLAEERFFPLDHEHVPIDMRQSMYQVAELGGDELVVEGNAQLRKAVQFAYQEYQGLSEELLLYYAYCQWLLLVLQESDQLMQSKTAPIYYRRYLDHHVELSQLTSVLRDELTQYGLPRTGIVSQQLPLPDSIGLVAARLASDWRQTVFSGVDQITGKPTQ